MHTKLLLFFLLFFSAVDSLPAQTKVIHHPIFANHNSESIDITCIERNDTATILFLEVYSRPDNWVRLASTTSLHGLTTGKEYKLLSSEGFKLDEKVFMPASGNVSFKLFFEPLDLKEQKINFTEGPHDYDFAINGIILNENYKKRRIHCHLSGTVVQRPQSSRLMLCKDIAELRTSSWISIPVKNGKFEYNLYTDAQEKYQLVFWDDHLKGRYIPVPFFSEKGKLKFTLRPYTEGELTPYDIKTSNPLTCEMLEFEKKQSEQMQICGLNRLYNLREELEKTDKYFSEVHKAFWKKFDEAKTAAERDALYRERNRLEENGAFYTDTAQIVNAKIKECTDSLFRWKLSYISKYPTLPSLYTLKSDMQICRQRNQDLTPYIEVYHNQFSKKFAKSPVGKQIGEFIVGLSLEVGKPYIDFSAPDLKGKVIKLSDQIGNKVALLDLWASWCGPCRRNSKSMIPIYEKYKDKGFTIVGVAREKDHTHDLELALQKDGYPWLNLVELNDQAQIWTKYGIPNAAGGTYLIDRNGHILAINPSKEELEAILEKIL